MVLPVALLLLVERLQAAGESVVEPVDEVDCLFKRVEWCHSEQWGEEKITPAIKADYEKARPDVSLKIDRPNRKFHDRYVFLDYGLPGEKLFLCGASSKDAGNKVTTIMQIECPEMYHPIIDGLKKQTIAKIK